MELQKLVAALHRELEEAGIPSEDASASLAFVAKTNRNSELELDFVDASSMSKPRPEDLHRLEVTLAEGPRPRKASDAGEEEEGGKGSAPPALPPRRT